MPVHSRKLKIIEFLIDSIPEFECQISTWNVVNNTEDGEKIYTYCPDGEDREDADDDYALELTFYSDWRENGISDWFTLHDKEWVEFQLDHRPDVPAEHVRWTGEVKIKAPSAGGEIRTTETNTLTLPIKGKPVYVRAGSSSSGV